MARLRIVQPGFTTFTGMLHTIAFTSGLSDLDVPNVQAQQLAANFLVEDNATPGVRFGEATGILPLVRGAAAASTKSAQAPADTALIKTITGSATIGPADSNAVIRVNSAGAQTISLPRDLPVGFSVAVVQAGAGQVTLAALTGATIRQSLAFTKSARQHAGMSALVVENIDGVSAAWLVQGEMVQ